MGSMKPQAKTPQDDFNSIAKGTYVDTLTQQRNSLGAELRIRIGVDNVRRLWKITKLERTSQTLRGGKVVRLNAVFLADGGINPWSPTNCYLDEMPIRIIQAEGCENSTMYVEYVSNPDNPFSKELEETYTYDKEISSIVRGLSETPRNCFCYIRRSNN